MVRLGMVEADQYGYYRLMVGEKKKKEKTHVSPQILNILKSSGKSFGTFIVDNDDGSGEEAVPSYRPPSARPTPTPKKSV